MALTSGRGDRAVFLDKDGTLIRDVPFNVDPELISLLPGVATGVRALFDAGYRLIVVSNQPGVALGLFPADALAGVETRLSELFADAGVSIDGYFWCTHGPRAPGSAGAYACTCRKPNPGLLHTAATLCGLDLASSWMIGDILDDVEAGHRAGCRAVLVDRGGETQWVRGPHREPDAIVPRFDKAVRFILDRNAGARAPRATDRAVSP